MPFDALAYGIPPSALASIETVQLLALEVAARALADAGYAERPFDRSRASAIFGAEPGSDLAAGYGLRSALPGYTGGLPAELDEHLPSLTEDSLPGVLGNVIAGRVANRLDLGGVPPTASPTCGPRSAMRSPVVGTVPRASSRSRRPRGPAGSWRLSDVPHTQPDASYLGASGRVNHQVYLTVLFDVKYTR